MGSLWWSVAAGVLSGLVLMWLAIAVVLWVARPGDLSVADAARLIPDLLRLVKGLAGDGSLPPGVRIRLVLLIAYLAMPIDLIPDFIPVIGFLDDAVIVALVLRSAVRKAGPAALAKHWPGTPEGLIAVCRLCGLPQPE